MAPLWLSCTLQKKLGFLGFFGFSFYCCNLFWGLGNIVQQQPLSNVQHCEPSGLFFFQNHERFCTHHCNFSRMSVFKYNFKTHIWILICEKHLNNTKKIKKRRERPAPAYPPHHPCQRYQTPFRRCLLKRSDYWCICKFKESENINSRRVLLWVFCWFFLLLLFLLVVLVLVWFFNGGREG